MAVRLPKGSVVEDLLVIAGFSAGWIVQFQGTDLAYEVHASTQPIVDILPYCSQDGLTKETALQVRFSRGLSAPAPPV